jgi:hypothetical protein
MKLVGAVGFERFYTLEGSSGEHRLEGDPGIDWEAGAEGGDLMKPALGQL